MRDDMDDVSESDVQEDTPAPRRRSVWRVLGSLALLALLAFTGLCFFIDLYGRWDQARPAQAIVILGARVEPNQQPGDSLRARTERAVALYKRGMAPKIICTGGLGDYPPTEALAAANLAMALGVPERDLLLETASTNTQENARFAANICREYGWTRLIAVSDPYHLWRVKRNFAAVGITVYPSPALACERHRKWKMRIQWTMREGLAVSRDLLREAVSKIRAR